MRPGDQLPGLTTVCPDQAQLREACPELLQHQLRPVTVLDVGGMNHHGQQQVHRVYDHMPLTASDLLARVLAARPPSSVVFTGWLAVITALGVGSRPAASRTWDRKALRMCSQLPSNHQRPARSK